MRRPIYVFGGDFAEGIEILVEIWPNVEDERERVTVAIRDPEFRSWSPPLEVVNFQTAEIREEESS